MAKKPKKASPPEVAAQTVETVDVAAKYEDLTARAHQALESDDMDLYQSLIQERLALIHQ